MEPVPPPHERIWRHPSELAPPPGDPASSWAKSLAIATGLAGLCLIGLVAVAVSPSPSDVVVAPASSAIPFRAGATAPASGPRAVATTEIVYVETGRAEVLAASGGDTRIGRVTVVWVTSRGEPTPVVTGQKHFVLADARPDTGERVRLLSSPPVDVAFGDVRSARAAPGTLVLDAEGALVAVVGEWGEIRVLCD